MDQFIGSIVEELRALEIRKAEIEARQASLALELDRRVRDRAAGRGEPAARQGRGVAEMIAAARRITPTQGRVVLAAAKKVASLPQVRGLWDAGELNEYRVITILREAAELEPEDVAELDARIAGRSGLGELAPKKIAHATRSIASELDPATVEARRAHAGEDRHVSCRPTDRGDGMGWLHALLPIEQLYAVKCALDAAADTAVAVGSATSRGQVRADTLIARVTGSDALGLDAPTHGVNLNLIMTDTALLGASTEPAWLSGMGPISAGLAKQLLLQANAAGMTSTLRRLYTEPSTGQLVAMESKARRFPPALTELIKLRDQLCRTPGCGASIAHIDHTDGWGSGGATSADNGRGTCRQCNWAKQNPDLDPETGSPPGLHPPRAEIHHSPHERLLASSYTRAA